MNKLLPLWVLAGSLFVSQAHADKPPIVVGQSASLTGGQAAYGRDVRDGVEALFAEVNAKGGVRGPTLKLVTLDDGGKKDAVVANTKALVELHGATALIGYTSGAGVEASLGYLEQAARSHDGPGHGQHGNSRGDAPSLVPRARGLLRRDAQDGDAPGHDGPDALRDRLPG